MNLQRLETHVFNWSVRPVAAAMIMLPVVWAFNTPSAQADVPTDVLERIPAGYQDFALGMASAGSIPVAVVNSTAATEIKAFTTKASPSKGKSEAYVNGTTVGAISIGALPAAAASLKAISAAKRTAALAAKLKKVEAAQVQDKKDNLIVQENIAKLFVESNRQQNNILDAVERTAVTILSK